MKDRITLGIPLYNAANLIERTLLSALNQTYPNIEYLFVDDKGDSMGIVHRVISEHPRKNDVRIIDQVYNQGTGAARNAIVDNATGIYLFTMDCDDVILPDCIEILYNKMQKQPVDFVAASFIRKDIGGNIYPGGCQYTETLINRGDYAVAKYRYELGNNIFVATWNKLYKTSFLRENKIQCIPHYLIDDTWFTYQVIICAQSCCLIPNLTLFFTYNPRSVTSVKEQEGYSYELAKQYLETQILKIEYIRALIDKSFYMGALVDIMKMSLYHLYRACASPKISEDNKKELLRWILIRRFPLPSRYFLFDKNLYKAIPLLAFYSLPMFVKQNIIISMVRINLREILRRWFHF